MITTCELNYDVLSLGVEHKLYLLVKVAGDPGKSERQPLPLNLSIVLDRSGSMKGEKLEFVKQAALSLVRRLGAKDRLSLVVYDTSVDVLVPPQAVTDREVFNRALRPLAARATTNLSGGWLQGCEFVGAALDERAVNRVLLLSDGLANVGIQDPNQLAALARKKRSEGVTTTALGVGLGFHEDLMTRMAQEGGGAFYFIDTPDVAPDIFNEELQDLQAIVGQNLTVTFASERAVRGIQQLCDYPHFQAEGGVSYLLGDLYAEEERHQVFELTLAPLPGGETRLGTVKVAYEAIEGEDVKRMEAAYEIVVKAVEEGELEVALPKLDVEKLALLQKAARAREAGVEHADAGRFPRAAAALREVGEAIANSPLGDEELEAERRRLLEGAMDMELGVERYDTHVRKLHAYSASSSHRHARYAQMADAVHSRHLSTKLAIERGGPAPVAIRWGKNSRKLVGERFTIGSADDNDIVLRGPRVAAHHCRLVKDGKDWYLEPLTSEGATFANSGLLGSRFRLSQGDVASVGGTLFEFLGEIPAPTKGRGGTEEQAHKLVQRGQEQEKRDDFAAAAESYRQALALNPRRAFARYFANNNLGYCLNQLGEHEAAEGFCRAAIAVDERRHYAHKNLGVSLGGQGDYVGAARAFIAAVEREPADSRALQHLETLHLGHPEIAGEIPDFKAKLEDLRGRVRSAS